MALNFGYVLSEVFFLFCQSKIKMGNDRNVSSDLDELSNICRGSPEHPFCLKFPIDLLTMNIQRQESGLFWISSQLS